MVESHTTANVAYSILIAYIPTQLRTNHKDIDANVLRTDFYRRTLRNAPGKNPIYKQDPRLWDCIIEKSFQHSHRR